MARKKNPKPKGPAPQNIPQRVGAAVSRGNSPFVRPHGYTLAEEARNTASNRDGRRGRDARLRYQPVVFVSAGFMDPLKDLEVPEQAAPPMQVKATAATPDVSCNVLPNALSLPELHTQSPSVNDVTETELHRSQEGRTADGSDVGSDSSEEVILFKGRNTRTRQLDSPVPKSVENGKDTVNATGPHGINLQSRLVREATDITLVSNPVPQPNKIDFISIRSKHKKRTRPGRRHPKTDTNSEEDDEEAAIIADYIANIRDDSDDDEEQNGEDAYRPSLGSRSFSTLRDLGGTDVILSQPSGGDESGDESGDELDVADEEDLQEERQIESGDELLARMIAKQEELGFGNNDIPFLDGAGLDDGWIAASSIHRRKKGASKKSRIFQGGSQFPSATMMAEAFDELDLMDIQNSRLQRSKKLPLSFSLSDSEVEDALNFAIKKDRLKKADKKKAREELRSQGLLGKNVNPHDLRVKYQGGMSLDDLANEIEAFILSTREQLILPPFDKGARKIVHAIANSLSIKSKSAGVGVRRFPILYRSKATLPYNETRFEQAFSRVRRTWFPRVDVDDKVVHQSRILRQTETRTGKSRAGKSSLVLREGDVVGQHASEIGVENKGRAMLEKMGWSKGMSLGTVETKGIIVPLTHVIKKTKAGLGDI